MIWLEGCLRLYCVCRHCERVCYTEEELIYRQAGNGNGRGNRRERGRGSRMDARSGRSLWAATWPAHGMPGRIEGELIIIRIRGM